MVEKEIEIDPDLSVAEVKELVRDAFHLHSILNIELIVNPSSEDEDTLARP